MNKLKANLLAAAAVALISGGAAAADWYGGMSPKKAPAVPAPVLSQIPDKGPGRVLATSYSITSGQVTELSPNLFVVEGEVFSYYVAKFGRKTVSGPLWFRKSDVKFSDNRVTVGGSTIADCWQDGKILRGFKCNMRPGIGIALKKFSENDTTFVLVRK